VGAVLPRPMPGRAAGGLDDSGVVSRPVRFDAPAFARRGGARRAFALGVVDLAVLWMRAVAVLILLSPVLAVVAFYPDRVDAIEEG
jgi:hypothetical protein